MSLDANVFFQGRLLVSADAWNAALASLHWDVSFAPGLNVRSASGFQRAYLRGRRTGAEMYFSDLSQSDVRTLGLAQTKIDRSVMFSSVYELEGAFVLSVSYALCGLASGVYFDPQSGQAVRPDQLRTQALALLARAPKLAGPEW